MERELTIGDITAVTIYQAALGVPGQLLPEDPVERAAVEHGESVFDAVGCSACHVPEMRLDSRYFVEPNPFNPPGTWADSEQSFRYDMTSEGQGPYLERDGDGAMIHAYTDLKRHDLCDAEDREDAIRYYCNEQLAQNRPDQDGKPGTEFFLTRKLWDVGNSAPYGHLGDLTTITEAILMHGGEARPIRDAFTELSFEDQQALVSFLYSLQVLPARCTADHDRRRDSPGWRAGDLQRGCARLAKHVFLLAAAPIFGYRLCPPDQPCRMSDCYSKKLGLDQPQKSQLPLH